MKSKTVLIILAGGKSSRMGFPKGLLKHSSTLWILSQIENYIGQEVYIGLGFDYQLYFEAIPWLNEALKKPISYKGKKIRVALNQTPEFGLFSTLQNVLSLLNFEGGNNTVLVLPIDVPLLNAKEQEKLIFDEQLISIPTYNNKKGHPVKLTSKFWKLLLNLNLTDEDSRLDIQIKKRNASEISLVEMNDASIIKNLNTPKDWQEFIVS